MERHQHSTHDFSKCPPAPPDSRLVTSEGPFMIRAGGTFSPCGNERNRGGLRAWRPAVLNASPPRPASCCATWLQPRLLLPLIQGGWIRTPGASAGGWGGRGGRRWALHPPRWLTVRLPWADRGPCGLHGDPFSTPSLWSWGVTGPPSPLPMQDATPPTGFPRGFEYSAHASKEFHCQALLRSLCSLQGPALWGQPRSPHRSHSRWGPSPHTWWLPGRVGTRCLFLPPDVLSHPGSQIELDLLSVKC